MPRCAVDSWKEDGKSGHRNGNGSVHSPAPGGRGNAASQRRDLWTPGFRLRKPPAFGTAGAVEGPAGSQLIAVGDGGTAGINPVSEERDDDGPFIMQDPLHLGVHLGPLLVVELSTGLDQ